MAKRYYLPDKTFRKFMNYIAKDRLYVYTCLQKDDIPTLGYGYFDDALMKNANKKSQELETLFAEVGLSFREAYDLVGHDSVEFEDYDKGLRKILKRYFPESMRGTIEYLDN
ncbi:hypothetical protein [Lysinibacillus sp. TE18511]